VAPFRYRGDMIELADARAFSASLGLTIKGRADMARRQFDLQGTVVPAYFLNSLLGRVPVIGKRSGTTATGTSRGATAPPPSITALAGSAGSAGPAPAAPVPSIVATRSAAATSARRAAVTVTVAGERR
jgi:hypothetical protein